MPLAVATRNSLLNAFAQNASYANTAVWVQLHLGDPGVAGTSNPAANTTRQQGTFATGAASGAIANTTASTWSSVSTTETYAWVSLWTASTAGTFLGTSQLSSSAAVNAGDTFSLPIGNLTITLT